MIDSITVKNIETHIDTTIECEQFTVLKGESDTGKSAIFRAVESLTEFTSVNTRFDEGKSEINISANDKNLRRLREDSVSFKCSYCETPAKTRPERCEKCNCKEFIVVRKKVEDDYYVDKMKCDNMGKGYNNLPEYVKDAFPFAVINLKTPFFPGIQTQMGQFIWKQISAAELSQVFSLLEGNDYIEDLVKVVKKELREDTSNIGHLETEISELTKEVAADEIAVEKFKTEYQEKKERFDILTDKVSKFSVLCDTLDELSAIKERIAAIELPEVTVDIEILAVRINDLECLTRLYDQMKATFASIKAIGSEIDELSEDSYDKISETLNKYTAMRDIYKILINQKDKVEGIDLELAEVIQEEKQFEQEMKAKFLDQNICPFSGFTLNSECKKKMLEG